MAQGLPGLAGLGSGSAAGRQGWQGHPQLKPPVSSACINIHPKPSFPHFATTSLLTTSHRTSPCTTSVDLPDHPAIKLSHKKGPAKNPTSHPSTTMPRRFDYDTDDERLPEGMVRVGYDADTQVYTFRDSDGSLWEGPPGCQYGRMTKVANAPKPPSDLANIDVEAGDADPHHADQPPSYDESEAAVPFLDHRTYTSRDHGTARWGSDVMAKHWRAELMPLLNFFMILALFLAGLFWFLGWMTSSRALPHCAQGSHAHQIQRGESCWSIAQMHGINVDQLQQANQGVNCDLLGVGGLVCVPAMPKA